MNEELKKELIELLFTYYEHGANTHTIVPNIDAEVIIKKFQQKLIEARIDENEKWYKGLTGRDYPELNPSEEKFGIHPQSFFNRIKELKGE